MYLQYFKRILVKQKLFHLKIYFRFLKLLIVVGSKTEVALFFENDFGLSCKIESDLVDYRNWGAVVEVVAVKGRLQQDVQL